MLVLVLGWTQCLPQGVGAPPAMLRGRIAGFPKKTGRPGLRRGGVGGYNLHSVPPNSPPDCGTPTTSRLYPFGAHIAAVHHYQNCTVHLNIHHFSLCHYCQHYNTVPLHGEGTQTWHLCHTVNITFIYECGRMLHS